MMKLCDICGEEFDALRKAKRCSRACAMEHQRRYARGHYAADAEAYKARTRANNAAYRARRTLDERRDERLRKVYGIGLDDYLEMFESQHGVCAACGDAPEGDKLLYVDHNHVTGAVRALLCQACNTAMGCVRDDPDRIMRLHAYAVRHALAETFEKVS